MKKKNCENLNEFSVWYWRILAIFKDLFGGLRSKKSGNTHSKWSRRPTPVVFFPILGAGDIRDLIQALSYVLRNESGNIMADIEAPRGRILTPYFVTDNARNLSVADYNILSKTFNISVSDGSFPSINVIEKINDNVFAYADKRGGGDAATF